MVASLASPRALRWLAAGIVGALVLAVVCFYAAAGYELSALFVVPVEGMFGATYADFRLRPGELAELQAQQRSLRATATGLYFATQALLAAAAAGTVWCGWQTRRDLRRWHWLSFLGFGCLASVVILASTTGSSKSGNAVLLGLDAIALLASSVDLARGQYGAPGRVIAWSTCALSLGLAALLAVAVK